MKELKGMKIKEMMKCDGCGQYHPVEDCEVVVVKMIKGKGCSLEANPLRNIETEVVYEKPIGKVVKTVDAQEEITPEQREKIKAVIKKRQAVPPAFLGQFFKEGNEFNGQG